MSKITETWAMSKITETGYNEWYPLPYYVMVMASDAIIDQMWEWNFENLHISAVRPGRTVETLIYTHICFHFKRARDRDWFILRWS